MHLKDATSLPNHVQNAAPLAVAAEPQLGADRIGNRCNRSTSWN